MLFSKNQFTLAGLAQGVTLPVMVDDERAAKPEQLGACYFVDRYITRGLRLGNCVHRFCKGHCSSRHAVLPLF